MGENKDRQFDFWLGSWELTWGEKNHGTSQIHRILDGRVIQENFDGGQELDLRGISVSVYDPQRDLWCQTWVDSQGSYLDFIGEFKDSKMTLSREVEMDGKWVQQRMVWYNISDNELDWNWERSDDDGQSWKLLWHIHYCRK